MGFSNERMRTGQLVNWFLLDGLELTPAGYPVTQALSLPFGVDHLIGFNELLTCKHPENAGVHFFLDDYQFERFWRMPERYLYALEKCPLVIGPDFSLYTDFPAPIQHWNHYRNQLLTAWLQHNGVCTIPTASWSDEDSFRWCFDGISKGGAVDKLAKPIGQETTLYRADHDDFLKRLKINNYQSMSDSQLRKALVGKTWTNDCLESTAYDSRDNPFWPQPGGRRSTGKHGQGGSVSGNREVLIRYHTAKSTRAAFIQPSQSEAVLAVGTHHKITGVRSTRTGPSHTLGSGKRVIELEIEVW